MFIPITIVKDTTWIIPTPSASSTPTSTTGSASNNMTATATVATNVSGDPSYAASALPNSTSRAASKPGFEGELGALCLIGVGILVRKKAS